MDSLEGARCLQTIKDNRATTKSQKSIMIVILCISSFDEWNTLTCDLPVPYYICFVTTHILRK